MMKGITVRMEENVMVVETCIPKELYDKSVSDTLMFLNDDEDIIYGLTVSDGEPKIEEKWIQCNSISNGNLAVRKILPMIPPKKKTMEDVKKEYGGGLLAANEYLPDILRKLQYEVDALDEIFPGETD